MKPEEKDLLLKDLCARLPYKQKVYYKIHYNSEEIAETLSGCLLDYFKTGKIAVVKPYLRLMSSMTFNEKNAYDMLYPYDSSPSPLNISKITDFFHKHYFDYRGLIEKGLALPAPEGMYEF